MAGTWKILAHTKLDSANATIDTGDWTSGGTVTNPDTLKVIIYTLSANNDHYCYIRYNGDSGTEYVYRKNSEGEIPDGNPNTNMPYNDIYVYTRNSFVTMHIKNKSDKEKIAIMQNTGGASGNTNYPARREYVSKWVDKTQQIKQITVHQGNGSNTFDANSYITVWGSVDDGTEDEKQTLADATRTELATATTTLDLSSASQTGTADTKFAVNTSSQQIDWEAKHDGSFDSIWWDLGASAVSDTAWVLHWTLNIDNKPEGNKWLITSLSSSVDSNGRNHRNSNSDSLCLTLTRHNDNGYSYFHIHDTDGASFGGSSNPNSGDGTATYDFPLDTDLFCELRRTSATEYIGTIRTGSHTGTVIGTITGSCASTVTGLRYLQFSNWDTTSVYDNGTFDGYIKDVKLYNNATEYSSTVSEAPNANTRYEETDTRKIYRWKQAPLEPVFHYKFSESSGDVINHGSVANADLTVGSLTRDQSTPSGIGNGMKTPNEDSGYAENTSRVNDYKFMHDGTSKWSITFWLKCYGVPDTSTTEHMLFGNVWTDDAGVGFGIRLAKNSDNSSSKARIQTMVARNAGGMPVNDQTADDMMPDTSNWHFYCITYDPTLSSNNLTISRDAETSGTGFSQDDTTNENWSTSNPTRKTTYMARPTTGGNAYDNGVEGTMAQVMIFKDVILTQANKESLYASGNGTTTIPDSKEWVERGTA